MSTEQAARVVELDERRAELLDGKSICPLTSKMPRPLELHIRLLAQRAGMSVSNWLVTAAIEKIVNDEKKVVDDEMKAVGRELAQHAKKGKPREMSDAAHDEFIRDAVTKPRHHK